MHISKAETYPKTGDHNGLRNEPKGAYNGGWQASQVCTTQVGNRITSSSLQVEDRHRCNQLTTNRCTTSRMSTRREQVLASITALPQKNPKFCATTYISTKNLA